MVGTGQEAGAHAAGLVAEPEIEARRLDLVGIERAGRPQRAGTREQPRDVLIGKNACLPQAHRSYKDRMVQTAMKSAIDAGAARVYRVVIPW